MRTSQDVVTFETEGKETDMKVSPSICAGKYLTDSVRVTWFVSRQTMERAVMLT